ncbi:hypothetical protein HRbin22_00336 [Candidatus Thermoflexus japonica]|uniref:Uncharacterized protein n=1 Tax=Candidatus Thermoflexus japonica TaxID=2035417 RepID=A0A2H5Y3V0_9CHLR|nr:hypothetical protein HRbin22_00336 [Candidatus Thermoflexus japonica]
MSAWLMELRQAFVDAVRIFTLEPQQSGLGLLADLRRMGRRGWAWILLLGGTIGLAFALTIPGVGAAARAGLERPVGTGLLALWVAFLWVLLVVTAWDLPAAFRFLTTLYTLYYMGVPLLTGPSLGWVLIPAFALFLFERTHPRSALEGWPGRVLWAVALAQFPPHPIRPLPLSLALKSLIGVGIAVLPLWQRLRLSRSIRGLLLASGLIAPYLVVWGASPAALGEGIRGMLQAVWGLSVPVWLWLGANLVEDGARLGRFWSRRMGILQARPHLFGLLPFLTLALGVLALPAFWSELLLDSLIRAPGRMIMFSLYQEIWHRIREWPPEAYLAARTAVGVLFILGAAGLWMRRRMDPLSFGQRYVALTVGAVAFLFAFYQAFFGALDLDLPQQWWPLLLVVLAWTWEPLKGLQELREDAEDLLEEVVAAALLLLTVVMVQQLTDPEALIRASALWPLLGAAVWGFPYLVFTALQTAHGLEEDRGISPVRPFLLGYGWMVPLTAVLPLEDRWLPPMAFLAGSMLLPPPEGSRLARWMYGAWIGLGAVGFRVALWIVPLPVLPFAGGWLERLYSRTPVEFLSAAYFLQAAGALLAALPFLGLHGPGWRGRLGGLLGALLWGLWAVGTST